MFGRGRNVMQHSTSTTTTTAGHLSRRQFLKISAGMGLSAAGMALLQACGNQPIAATEKLETTTIRLARSLSICTGPQYLAEDLLKNNGFTEVQYVNVPTSSILEALSSGQTDMALQFSGPIITSLDAGKPIIVLAGIH